MDARMMFENWKTNRARKGCFHTSLVLIERITKTGTGEAYHSKSLRCKKCGGSGMEVGSPTFGFDWNETMRSLDAAASLLPNTCEPWPPERPWNERHFPPLDSPTP